jgi:hypothetical protein
LASPDYTGDINRIIEILKDDIDIYTNPVTSGKLRDIYFGEDNFEKHDRAMPYALVTTTNTPFLTKDQVGIGDGSTDPQITVQYVIKVFTNEGRAQKAEELLYGFVNKIVTRLKANPRLKEPAGLTDPKCIRSFVKVEPDRNTRGQEIQGAMIILECQIGSQSSATLTGGLVLDLLSFSAPEGFNFDENLTDDQLRCVDPSSDRGTWLLEYENTPTNDAAIRALLGTVGTFTLTRFGVSRVIKVAYITITPSPRIDEIERSILHLELTL